MVRQTTGTVHTGLALFDRQNVIRYWNKRMADLTGLSASEAIGRPLADLLPWLPHTGFLSRLGRLRRNERLKHSQAAGWSSLTPDAAEICASIVERHSWLSLTDGPEPGGPNRKPGARDSLIGILTLRTLPATAGPGRVLAPASRDAALRLDYVTGLRRHLDVPVKLVADMAVMLETGSLSAGQQQCVAALVQASRTLSAFLEDATELAQLDAHVVTLEPETLDLRAFLADTLHLFDVVAEHKHLAVRLTVAEDVPGRIMCDSHKLRQLLMHLLSNAFRFTDKGSVSLDVRCMAPDGSMQPGQSGQLEFEIRDTGIGMASARLKQLFRRFRYRVRRPGDDMAAMGLSVCAAIIDLLGGSLDVRSTLGRGSKIMFRLPLVAPSQMNGTAPANGRHRPEPGISRRVLLADAGLKGAAALVPVLESLGMTTTLVASEEAIIERIQAGETFDILLVDTSLPGLDLMQLANHVRSLISDAGEIPILALTRHTMLSEMEMFLDCGIDGFLDLPTLPSRLRQGIEQAIRTRQTAKPVPSLMPVTPRATEAGVL